MGRGERGETVQVGFRLRVQGSGLRVWGVRFRVLGFCIKEIRVSGRGEGIVSRV